MTPPCQPPFDRVDAQVAGTDFLPALELAYTLSLNNRCPMYLHSYLSADSEGNVTFYSVASEPFEEGGVQVLARVEALPV